MASPNGSWTMAGGKKNKPQNSRTMSKGKKKAIVENMPRIEPNRELLGHLLALHLKSSNVNDYLIYS